MRKLLLILFVVTAGCSTLTPVEPSGSSGTSYLAYFWPDSSARYDYVSMSDEHIITVSKNGGLVDSGKAYDSVSILKLYRSSSLDSISGLSAADVFGFDPSLMVVSSTTPSLLSPPPPLIRSIGNLGGALIVATDNAISLYHPTGDSLERLASNPAGSSVRIFQADRQKLYIVSMGGYGVWSFDGVAVSPVITSSTPIQQFFADNDHVWVASGKTLYSYDGAGGGPYTKSFAFSNVITAIDRGFHIQGGQDYDISVGLDNGALYGLNEDGSKAKLPTFFPPIRMMNSGLIGTDKGLFTINGQQISPGPVSALYQGQGIVYTGYTGDSVWVQAIFGNYISSPTNLDFPIDTAITQFTVPDSNVYAVAGTRLYRHVQRSHGWILSVQNTGLIPRWTPGGFALLKNAENWIAGYVEDFDPKDLRGFTYQASVQLHNSAIQLDGIQYSNVMAVSYQPYAGTQQVTDAPSYLIYYQLNVGPIRIERTENSNKTVYRLAR